MTYLDNGATTFPKPPAVTQAMVRVMETCGNPGRGGYDAAMRAGRVLLRCRETAGEMFDCCPEHVVLTGSCTHGLNMAIRSLVKPGSSVVVSGFEHNAVLRPLHSLGARILVAGRKLFDRADTLTDFARVLRQGVDAAVFTHVSNVFGYILPVEEMAALCRAYGVPFIVDCAQSAGTLPVSLAAWGADFIAMPGHKGLLGPMGTGLLLCNRTPEPLLQGGTGSNSRDLNMPDFLPDAGEAGTANVPGIAGLTAGMEFVRKRGLSEIFRAEHTQMRRCAEKLKNLGFRVFTGENQCGCLSFTGNQDPQELADFLGNEGICVRAGLHCAPLAHESAGTLDSGTIRVSYGVEASADQTGNLVAALGKYLRNREKSR